jgi:hypothetical protein
MSEYDEFFKLYRTGLISPCTPELAELSITTDLGQYFAHFSARPFDGTVVTCHKNTPAGNAIYTCLLDSPAQAGPFDGGCLILAQALCLAFPNTRIVHLVNVYGVIEHFGVMQNRIVYDMDGPASPKGWISRFIATEHPSSHVMSRTGYSPSVIKQDLLTSCRLAAILNPSFASNIPH